MLRISIFKELFERDKTRPFNISIDKLHKVNNVVYHDTAYKIIAGNYIENEKQCLAWELDNIREVVCKKLNKDCTMLIFTHTYIDRELANIEKSMLEERAETTETTETTETWLKELRKNDKELDLEKSLIQLADFKKAIDLLKDREKFLDLIPFEVECIVVAVVNDTDEDKIIKGEAELCGEIEAPNRNIFNIYLV